MEIEIVYVTVGTTKFDALIKEIVSHRVLELFKARGCCKLIIQYGTGSAVDAERIHKDYGIIVEQYDFKFDTIRQDIVNASLVIGHAGAGTCMDILQYGKAGLVVINDSLMDNHQNELAVQLSKEGYIYCCNVRELPERIETLDINSLRPYEQTNNIEKFVRALNQLMES